MKEQWQNNNAVERYNDTSEFTANQIIVPFIAAHAVQIAIFTQGYDKANKLAIILVTVINICPLLPPTPSLPSTLDISGLQKQ